MRWRRGRVYEAHGSRHRQWVSEDGAYRVSQHFLELGLGDYYTSLRGAEGWEMLWRVVRKRDARTGEMRTVRRTAGRYRSRKAAQRACEAHARRAERVGRRVRRVRVRSQENDHVA